MTKAKKNVLSKGEVIALVNKSNNMQIKAAISMMYITGGRVSEVLAVKAKDLWKEDDKFLCIQMPVLKKRKINAVSKIVRKVPLQSFFTKTIISWVNDYNQFQPDDYLFQYTRKHIWKKIKHLDPEVHPHLFRHSLATEMGKRVSMKVLQDWFAWSNLNMAQTYVHNKDAINIFANAMEDFN